MSAELLRTDRLRVGYGAKTVVEDVSLLACPGQILTLIGPNGAGKSTILKTLMRQLSPLGGAIFLSGKTLETFPQAQLAKVSAAVFTGRPRPELMRCVDVVSAGRYPYTGRLGILSERDHEVIRETMRLVGIADIAAEDFDRISDGQRQRVLLARAICQEPKLLILDEPTSFLDIRNKLEFLHLLRQLVREKQISVVMSMHELDLAQKFSDQVACVKDGKIDRIGTPEEIFAGNYIGVLYGVEHGSFEPLFGSAEPEGNGAAPEVFVIGGGGSGIPVYRRLQRMGIPFAVGVLHENDLDLPAARALASRVIIEQAFAPISREKQAEAMGQLLQCRYTLCPLENFGPMNSANAALRDQAEARNLLVTIDALEP